MIKNRTTQLIFQVVYCTLAIVGLAGSLGYFTAQFRNEFHLFYTTLSNYVCYCFMFISLIFTIKANKKDGFVTFAPRFKFMSNVLILVTFFVYNFLLAGYEHTFVSYVLNPTNMLNHLILPIMFVLDWVLFYEHGKTRWFYPFLCVIMPIIYVSYIFIRALILAGSYTGTIYPYFFLNPEIVGSGGVIVWIIILFVLFIVMGFTIYFLDNIKRFCKILKNKQKEKKL